MSSIIQQWLDKFSPCKLALLATLFFILVNIFVILVIVQNNYSPFLHNFGEMFEKQAADNYIKFGFLNNAGMPTISTTWLKHVLYFKAKITGDEYHVYLHYPAISSLLGGVSEYIFGGQDIRLFRVIPLLFNSLMLFVFFRGVFSVLEQGKDRFIFLCIFTAIPMGWLLMHAFGPHSYAHYSMLGYMGFLLPMLRSEAPELSWKQYFGAGFFGFLAALFTFDYFFVTLFLPATVASLYHGDKIFKPSHLRRAVFYLCFFSGFGFTFGHFTHLLQVIAYYGSLQTAVTELWNSAVYRATFDKSHYEMIKDVKIDDCEVVPYCSYIASQNPISGRLILLFDYLFRFTAVDSRNHFILILPIGIYTILIGCWLILFGNISSLKKARASIVLRNYITMCGIGLLSCSLWLLVMENHSAYHTFIFPRHFYMVFILLVLFALKNAKKTMPAAPAQ